MAQVLYPDTMRVVCTQRTYGEVSVNVFHVDAGSTQGGDFDFHTKVTTEFGKYYSDPEGVAPAGGLAGVRPTFSVLESISTQYLGVLPYPAPFVTPFAEAGDGAGCLPLDLAICISLKTATSSRTGRGRSFIGPLASNVATTASATVPPQISAAAKGICRDAIQRLDQRLRALSPAPSRLGVLSIKDGVLRPVTSVKVDSNFDVQRRRSNDISYVGATSAVVGS